MTNRGGEVQDKDKIIEQLQEELNNEKQRNHAQSEENDRLRRQLAVMQQGAEESEHRATRKARETADREAREERMMLTKAVGKLAEALDRRD